MYLLQILTVIKRDVILTKIRVLFNLISTLDLKVIVPKVKSLGINSISIFGTLQYETLPSHFKIIKNEFEDVVVNLYHPPTFENRKNWEQILRKDGERTIAALAEVGINHYAWMIELNLYGQSFNPLVKRYVSRNKLHHHFNTFYEIAHDVNPDAKVIIVPYPHALINLDCGFRGWKDWWVKKGENLKFDMVSLNAHIGTWIPAPTRANVIKHLTNSINFLQDRGHPVFYVEVGYPTHGFKPLLGWYGWGREKDQISMLKTCYQALKARKVPYMQVCEFIDPHPGQLNYEPFFGEQGKHPKFLGMTVTEELHWGLLRCNGTEKLACKLIRKITKS